MSHLVFLDTETTGLDPDHHEVWEVAAIARHDDGDREHLWYLPVDLGRADPMALKISGFHDRYPLSSTPRDDGWHISHPHMFAAQFARVTRGAHLVGAVPSFDEERLRRLLRANGECPMWHYHLIDVETMAVGWLHGRSFGYTPEARAKHIGAAGTLPWRSDDLSLACGVEPPDGDERHTALGDARWVRDWYDAVTGGAS